MPVTPLPIWKIAAGEAAGAAAGEGAKGIMGLMLGGLFNKRQIKQQRRMNELSKEMTDYNMQKQLEMWEKTGYGATKEQIKEAGLNPAMLYGMGGAGGQSTNVETGREHEAMSYQATGMGMNLELLRSQINLQNAQAEKTKVEAEKIKGVDTAAAEQGVQESKARVESLMQGIDNAKQQYELQRLEVTLKNMTNYEQQRSQEDRLDYIMYQTGIAAKQWEIAKNEAYISSKTRQEKVDIIRAEAIGAVLRNALTKEATKATTKGIAVDQQKIEESINRIMQDWDKMEQTNREILIKDVLKSYNTDPVNEGQAIKAISDIFKIVR